jgi:hypothetical protein
MLIKSKSILFAAVAATTALWAMPATARGQIYVTNYTVGTIGEYTTSGATVNAALVSGLLVPYGITVLTAPVPEPSTVVLACLAAAGLAVPMLPRRRHCRP